MATTVNFKKIATKELIILFILLLIGLVIVPVSVYFVGEATFGEYGNGGLGAFMQRIAAGLRNFEPAVWLIVLSPYCAVQVLRLSWWSWRTRKKPISVTADP